MATFRFKCWFVDELETEQCVIPVLHQTRTNIFFSRSPVHLMALESTGKNRGHQGENMNIEVKGIIANLSEFLC